MAFQVVRFPRVETVGKIGPLASPESEEARLAELKSDLESAEGQLVATFTQGHATYFVFSG